MNMPQTHSKKRQRAEIALSKAQSQLLMRGRAAEERDSVVVARAEKTLLLREARLAKELQDRATAKAGFTSKRAKKV
jgi:hypothetical protein